jgi:Bacterial regulatory helix-turn-helix protein, lysR family
LSSGRGIETSRRLYITHPSISEAVSSLESELGIKLFSRDGHVARLTPEVQVFYEEPIKTLAQAERSIAIAQRAAKGEIGGLGIGFIGFASGRSPRICSATKLAIQEWRTGPGCLAEEGTFDCSQIVSGTAGRTTSRDSKKTRYP